MHKNLIYFLLLGFFLFACSEDAPIKKLSSSSTALVIESPKSGSKFNYGDTIRFSIKLKDNVTKQVDKVKLYMDGNVIHESTSLPLDFDYLTATGGGGNVNIKAQVQYKEGGNSRRSIGIKIYDSEPPKAMAYEMIKGYDHDATRFTQGLVYEPQEDLIYEGTGNYGESRLIKWRLNEENAQKDQPISNEYFGEGIALMNDTLYQLTYKKKTGFYYDKDFNKLGEFTYPSEGWGLTHNGEHLIMSDGSSRLYFINPKNFQVDRSMQVFSNRGPMVNLNELEYVDGIIYANIYMSDLIAKIDAQSGRLMALIDMKGLLEKKYKGSKIDVLNGIAYNPNYDVFYVTGKWWPRLYEVRFYEVED